MQIIRVGVGVEDSDHGDSELLGLVDSEVLTNGIDNPEGARSFLQGANTTERLLQLGQLTLFEQQLLLGVTLGGVLLVDFFEFFHATQALRHGLEVGQ